MPQLGEPFEWDNPWEGTEFEDIIDELIQKTDGNRERLTKLETIVEGIQYDLKSFTEETIKVMNNNYKKNFQNYREHLLPTYGDDYLKTYSYIYRIERNRE